MIGDIVGETGLKVLEAELFRLKRELNVDLAVANGENAANGFGLCDTSADRVFSAGVDIITSGNHIWEKRDFWPRLENDPRIIRPANMPERVLDQGAPSDLSEGSPQNGEFNQTWAPGRGWTQIKKGDTEYFIINLIGRELMRPVDCPFQKLDVILEQVGSCGAEKVLLVDMHAESTQEKEALAFHALGRVSALVGTHTHVATSDGRILDGKTAYQSDLGMTGGLNSVIGMEALVCVERMQNHVPARMNCASGEGTISAALVHIDLSTGYASSIERISFSSIS